MIDPENVTNYNMTSNQLEEFILFWICAAGKNGKTAARCLDNLLSDLKMYFSFKFSPFELIRKTHIYSNNLPDWLKVNGIGCYNSKARTMLEISNSKLDLKTCSVDDLEKIYGIGMKTSRCFIIHSRRNSNYAGLDTHVLKHLREVGIENVPKSTPSSKKQYKRLEKEFLKLAKGAGTFPADYDLMVWNKYSVNT